jgi:hypothetical protein
VGLVSGGWLAASGEWARDGGAAYHFHDSGDDGADEGTEKVSLTWNSKGARRHSVRDAAGC